MKDIESPIRLLDWLLQKFPRAKRTNLRRMLQDRRITINGLCPGNLDAPVCPGDTVLVAPHARPGPAPRDPRLRIIHEDEDILVVDKPAGLLTSTVARERRATLLEMVRCDLAGRRPEARVGLIHRLDKDAAGLLVFSLNDLAYRSLKSQFFRHSVGRVYFTVVEGIPFQSERMIHSRLVELPDGRVRTSLRPMAGQPARTQFVLLRRGTGRAMLRVTLHTGRKHQIRVHLSEAGHPIVGDEMYEAPPAVSARRKPAGRASRPSRVARTPGPLLLQASELAFDHPRTGRRLTFTLPVPPAFIVALDNA